MCFKRFFCKLISFLILIFHTCLNGGCSPLTRTQVQKHLKKHLTIFFKSMYCTVQFRQGFTDVVVYCKCQYLLIFNNHFQWKCFYEVFLKWKRVEHIGPYGLGHFEGVIYLHRVSDILLDTSIVMISSYTCPFFPRAIIDTLKAIAEGNSNVLMDLISHWLSCSHTSPTMNGFIIIGIKSRHTEITNKLLYNIACNLGIDPSKAHLQFNGILGNHHYPQVSGKFHNALIQNRNHTVARDRGQSVATR